MKPPPPLWGKDELSDFFQASHENSWAFFVNNKAEFELIKKVDKLFRTIPENLINSEHLISNNLFLNSHSSFLAAARLCFSGHTTPAYTSMRLCLESALYALFVAKNNSMNKIWLNRHDDEESYKAVRQKFTMRAVLDNLKALDKSFGDITEYLYGETIDFGAHPNVNSILSVLDITEENKNGTVTGKYNLNYLTGDPVVVSACIKTLGEIGICAMEIFQHVYPERFEILSLDETISSLKSELNSLIIEKKKSLVLHKKPSSSPFRYPSPHNLLR